MEHGTCVGSKHSHMKISFIIVNYKSEKLLSCCLAAIQQHATSVEYETIVVNNDEVLLDSVSAHVPPKIINNNENRGFAKACNAGAAAAIGDILFFLNPDTKIATPNINELIEKLIDPAVGIVAPRLVTSSGSVQPWSAGCATGLWDTLWNNLGYAKSKKLWLQDVPGEVDWVSGAALVIPKRLFSECGGFDENFFMYFEDADLCKRIRLLGKKILLLPQVRVLHLSGQCQSDRKTQKQHYYQSQDYYFRKHFGKVSAFFIKILRKICCF